MFKCGDVLTLTKKEKINTNPALSKLYPSTLAWTFYKYDIFTIDKFEYDKTYLKYHGRYGISSNPQSFIFDTRMVFSKFEKMTIKNKLFMCFRPLKIKAIKLWTNFLHNNIVTYFSEDMSSEITYLKIRTKKIPIIKKKTDMNNPEFCSYKRFVDKTFAKKTLDRNMT